MTRRARLPAETRDRLHILAAAGIGLDSDAPTRNSDGVTVAAAECLSAPPSPHMRAKADEVRRWLLSSGARHAVVDHDPRAQNEPGSLIVVWLGDITPETVAAQFASSHDCDGLPLVPVWLKLRSESMFDMRWQRTY